MDDGLGPQDDGLARSETDNIFTATYANNNYDVAGIIIIISNRFCQCM